MTEHCGAEVEVNAWGNLDCLTKLKGRKADRRVDRLTEKVHNLAYRIRTYPASKQRRQKIRTNIEPTSECRPNIEPTSQCWQKSGPISNRRHSVGPTTDQQRSDVTVSAQHRTNMKPTSQCRPNTGQTPNRRYNVGSVLVRS